jgi:hypothetical protein
MNNLGRFRDGSRSVSSKERSFMTLVKPSRYIDQKEYLTQVKQALWLLIDTIDQRADLDIGWEVKAAEMRERAEADYRILKNYLR